MRQEVFEAPREERWQRLERVLDQLDAREAPSEDDFPKLYRQVCQDLALARDRQFGGNLVDRLNLLALRGHQHLYQARVGGRNRVLRFIVRDFPRAVRREWRLFALMSLLFYGTGFGLVALLGANPDLIHSLFDENQLSQFESMYDPEAEHVGLPRGYDDDVLAFGYYILNNIGIAFRTFASGLVFGIGSLFIVTFNGVVIGAIAGHLTNQGFGVTFWPFVVGHGSFELTAIVLSGVAGMRLGLSLVAPGPYTRGQALRNAARGSLVLVYGAAGMLLVAAVIEAFWSANAVFPALVKYGVGAALWGLVALYLLGAGRSVGD